MPFPAAFMKKGKAAGEEESPEAGEPKGKKPCKACAKKGKKKGSCGCDSKPKMDGALSPQEYLDACDLGIQDRSKSYIRTRLDVMATAGKGQGTKCGNSYIGKGKKCKSGAGGLASTTSTGGNKAKVGKALSVAGRVGQAVSWGVGVNKAMKGDLRGLNRSAAAAGGFGALQGAGNVIEGKATGNNKLRNTGYVRVGLGAAGVGLNLAASGDLGKAGASLKARGLKVKKAVQNSKAGKAEGKARDTILSELRRRQSGGASAIAKRAGKLQPKGVNWSKYGIK